MQCRHSGPGLLGNAPGDVSFHPLIRPRSVGLLGDCPAQYDESRIAPQPKVMPLLRSLTSKPAMKIPLLPDPVPPPPRGDDEPWLRYGDREPCNQGFDEFCNGADGWDMIDCDTDWDYANVISMCEKPAVPSNNNRLPLLKTPEPPAMIGFMPRPVPHPSGPAAQCSAPLKHLALPLGWRNAIGEDRDGQFLPHASYQDGLLPQPNVERLNPDMLRCDAALDRHGNPRSNLPFPQNQARMHQDTTCNIAPPARPINHDDFEQQVETDRHGNPIQMLSTRNEKSTLCDICDVECYTLANLNHHLASDVHARQQRLANPERADYCTICQFRIRGEMNEHQESSEHKRKERLTLRGCLLCRTTPFKSYHAYLAHINRTEHRQKKHDLLKQTGRLSTEPRRHGWSPSRSPPSGQLVTVDAVGIFDEKTSDSPGRHKRRHHSGDRHSRTRSRATSRSSSTSSTAKKRRADSVASAGSVHTVKDTSSVETSDDNSSYDTTTKSKKQTRYERNAKRTKHDEDEDKVKEEEEEIEKEENDEQEEEGNTNNTNNHVPGGDDDGDHADEHQIDTDHTKNNGDADAMGEKTSRQSDLLQKLDLLHSSDEIVFDPTVPIGEECIIAVSGYFCRLCRKFYMNEEMAKVAHCSTEQHFERYQMFLSMQATSDVCGTVDSEPDGLGVKKADHSHLDGSTVCNDSVTSNETRAGDQIDATDKSNGVGDDKVLATRKPTRSPRRGTRSTKKS